MIQVAPGWNVAVDRGPDWLFVHVECPDQNFADKPPLAETVWSVLEQHFTYRLVLELDSVRVLQSYLVGQMVLLHKRITSHGGLMRLSGVSPANALVLRTLRLDDRFPCYADRADAVIGHRPPQPR